MSIQRDDPRLTAYVLDELDPSERAAVEELLTRDEDCRRAVEEIRAVTGRLEEELGREPAPALTELQRARIERELAEASPTAGRARPRRWRRLAALAAAVLLPLALLLSVTTWRSLYSARGSGVIDRSRGPGSVQEVILPPPPPAPQRLVISSASESAREAPERLMDQRVASALQALGYIDELRTDSSLVADAAGGEGLPPGFDTEAYASIRDNPFFLVRQEPLSTFSVDVDTASYSNVRRFLSQGRHPPADAVRIEELVNYFSYGDAPPTDGRPFAAHVEVAECPWKSGHRLVRIGLKGREIPREERPPSNLVFLIDVSGSMRPENKLPLLKRALRLLVEQLGADDRVAIVVYAGASGLVLPSTSADDRGALLDALTRLEAGGSTHGSAGIRLAYQAARAGFLPGGTNRVILCTDGDFNVGVTSEGELTRLIEKEARSGVFLSVLGFGMGNFKDATLERLADQGNGNYAYVDTLAEARKVLVEDMTGTLVTIAKDVKIQVEFNPAAASAYRLLGYENRLLRHQDFNDDTRDAGEIGAGHSVTALYQVVPAGVRLQAPGVDPLRYQDGGGLTDAASGGELLTLKLRYKEPEGERSTKMEIPVRDPGESLAASSDDLRFAAAVAAFGMVLRDSPFRGEASLDLALELGRSGLGRDSHGHRAGFLELVELARSLPAANGE